MKKVKVIDLFMLDRHIYLTSTHEVLSFLEDEIDSMYNYNDTIELKLSTIEMTEKEFKEMPEFDGF